MAKNRTVSTNQLENNELFLIQGKVTYSRIRTQIAGEELIKANARRAQQGINPKNNPYTTISICDAQVVRSNPNDANMSLAEIYATESLYQSNSKNAQGLCYSIDNTSRYLPRICVRNGSQVDELPADQIHGELANGLLVTLVMRVYNTNKPNKGVTLDAVICDEPIRFYGGASANLEKYGLTLNMQETRQAAQPPMQPAIEPNNPLYPNNNNYTGYPQQNPAYMPQPASAYPQQAPNYPQNQQAAPAYPQQNPATAYPPQQAPNYPQQAHAYPPQQTPNYPQNQPAAPSYPQQAAAPTYPQQNQGQQTPEQTPIMPNQNGYSFTPGMDTAPFGQPNTENPANPYDDAPGIVFDPNAPERGY